MSFQSSNNASNGFKNIVSNSEEAVSMLPSIYSGPNKYMTSTEWADKAANWVRAKQTNEAIWNTFGLPPTPKPADLTPDLQTEVILPPVVSCIAPQIGVAQSRPMGPVFDPATFYHQASLTEKAQETEQEVGKQPPVERKRRVVPNWIKSAKMAKLGSSKTASSDVANKKTDVCKINQRDMDIEIREKAQEKVKKLSQEIATKILHDVTTQMVFKLCENAIETLTTKNTEREVTRKNRSRHKHHSSYSDLSDRSSDGVSATKSGIKKRSSYNNKPVNRRRELSSDDSDDSTEKKHRRRSHRHS